MKKYTFDEIFQLISLYDLSSDEVILKNLLTALKEKKSYKLTLPDLPEFVFSFDYAYKQIGLEEPQEPEEPEEKSKKKKK